MVTLFLFLAASALQVIKDATTAMHLRPALVFWLSLAYVISCFGMLIAFSRCVWAVQGVLRPRGARHYKNPAPGSEMLWQDHVIAHGTNTNYSEAVKKAEPELLLKNLTDQVFELAHISREKMDALQHGRRAIWLGFWCWCVARELNLRMSYFRQ